MATNRQIQYMLRHPHLMARFQLTGELPHGVRPKSPLIDAIQRIAPAYRARMVGFQVSPDLGYAGSRRFHTVAQALLWLAPSDEVFGAFPAESWRIKGFHKVLTFEDVAAHCSSVPDGVRRRYALPASR